MKNQNQINTNERSENQNHNYIESVIFEPIVPHPQPVAIGDLLTDIEAIIKRPVCLARVAPSMVGVAFRIYLPPPRSKPCKHLGHLNSTTYPTCKQFVNDV